MRMTSATAPRRSMRMASTLPSEAARVTFRASSKASFSPSWPGQARTRPVMTTSTATAKNLSTRLRLDRLLHRPRDHFRTGYRPDEASRPRRKDPRHQARERLDLEAHRRRDRRHVAGSGGRRAAGLGGVSPFWVVGPLPGQRKLPKPLAEKAASLFGLSEPEKRMLNEVTTRGTSMPPPDPLLYRFYEMGMVNGPALKALIGEEFGDGNMSAIGFDLELDRLANPKGDRVRLVMSGKFLPYKYYGAEQGVPEYGFKEG